MNSDIVPDIVRTPSRPANARPSLEEHRGLLWGLCYRMTGTPADADDLVQETFLKALEHPPSDVESSLRPWLVRVAMNLARDTLRRRKRRSYVGVWLPAPVDTIDGESAGWPEPATLPDTGPEAHYGAKESASYAFLLALEALTATQRAVLLLRDVLDFSVKETADSLDMSEANVKTTHHRARAAMASYDRERQPLDENLRRRVEETLAKMMACMATGDVSGLRELLADDVLALSDGGGYAFAARSPVRGAGKIARMYIKLSSRASAQFRGEIRLVNGLPALVFDDPAPSSPSVERAVFRIELDANGKVREIHSIAAPPKLTAVASVP